MDWQLFWEGGKELSLSVLMARAVILYIALIIATRLMGHRQVGILSGHNYLVAAGIVSLAAVRMVNPQSSLTSGLVIVFAFAGVNVLLSYLDLKWPRAIDQQASVLMEDGKLIKSSLMDCHITIDNLLGQLRLKGVHSLSDLDAVILEPYGKISISKKPAALPVTRVEMQLSPKPTALSTILIYDGVIQEENLRQIGFDRQWLAEKLLENGTNDCSKVFLAMLEASGSVYIST
jgi:uncharacterized membrane protein YcaP (DUF421 family)